MNGIHDMGGMHGLGPLEHDPNEPAFHEAWEGRAWALLRAAGPFGPSRRRNFRFELERIPAVEYLELRYYERLLKTLVDRLVEGNFVTRAEIETGRPAASAQRATPRVTQASFEEQLARRVSLRRDDVRVRAGFAAGQRVLVRNLNPLGHTRLPRYVRGKHGRILRDHGVFNLQDTDAEGYSLGDQPQHVYTVRFEAAELWGPQGGPRDSVCADLWEGYLERA
jgi:nitrile hydratase